MHCHKIALEIQEATVRLDLVQPREFHVIQALTALEVLGTRCSALRLRVTTALVVLLLLMAFHVPRDTLLMVGGAFQ
jgi:hypothetical protein